MKDDVKIFAMTVGVPGSGKSTFLTKIVNSRIISRDKVRFAILDKYNTKDYFSHEDEVWETFVNEIANALNDGEHVIADATHLSKGSRTKLINAVMPKLNDKNVLKVAIYFDVPLDVCLERNAQREGLAFVPENQIKEMYRSLTKPDKTENINVIITVNKNGETKEISVPE